MTGTCVTRLCVVGDCYLVIVTNQCKPSFLKNSHSIQTYKGQRTPGNVPSWYYTLEIHHCRHFYNSLKGTKTRQLSNEHMLFLKDGRAKKHKIGIKLFEISPKLFCKTLEPPGSLIIRATLLPNPRKQPRSPYRRPQLPDISRMGLCRAQ